MAPPDHDSSFVFDRTINLGHILTFVGFLATMVVVWSTLDKRVVILEVSRVHQIQIDARQDYEMAESKRLMRDDLQNINTKLDRLIEKSQNK